MVRDKTNKEEGHVAGRPDKSARQTPEETAFEEIPADKKGLALSEMQTHVEAGERETEALRHATEDVERGDPRVDEDVREARRRGRPEGET